MSYCCFARKRVQGDPHSSIPQVVLAFCTFLLSAKFIFLYFYIVQFHHLHICFWRADPMFLSFTHCSQGLFVK